VTTAERLHPVVLHHIVNSLGWPRLRELQEAAVEPLLAGHDALLLAPTAGGKTEAAAFPLLSRMAFEDWRETSLLYLCPLKALLNNLLPRLESYAGWLGRRTALWHGDVITSRRRKILTERPDVLLTTPESVEAMLVSANVDHAAFLGGVRAVVVDEVHAFAGDDRGWHLLAVLERLTHLVGEPLQRVGLSATVGNAEQLLRWLQGSSTGKRQARVVAPHLSSSSASGSAAEAELDYVGSLQNAAMVIASLHRGEKRLVFCESRKQVEELGALLRSKGITTFLSHASLSLDDRRRSEAAFAEARDCVIVSTSTLELGVDVGDLDRVIQIDSPATVAAFLQRIGRAGRRAGSTRSCLFLTLNNRTLLQAAGLLHLWGRGWVEPVSPPPEPRHILAQQILALCLQQHRVGDQSWQQWWNGLPPFTREGSEAIVRYLVEHGYLETDGGMLFIGPEAELRFGRRHFMGMTAVFTAAPQFTVLAGRTELGRVDPSLLTEEIKGPRRLLLGGRSWQVTYIDWTRRRCFVEPAEGGGKARWTSYGMTGLSYPISRAMREILLGTDPPAKLTQRARNRLEDAREELSRTVRQTGTVIIRTSDGVRWWTWAGYRANATLASTLITVADPLQETEDHYIRLREDLTAAQWRAEAADAAQRLCLPHVHEKALVGLKFSSALPKRLAEATLAARLADLPNATAVLEEPVQFLHA
jgi:ATP-dependent helicase Lhr and Lhr-like helicase